MSVRSSAPSLAATRAFDRLAAMYDTLADGELFRLMRRRTHTVFARWLHPGCRVLEIGCGTGLDTAFLAARGIRVVACDPSEAMVARTLSRLSSEGLASLTRVMPCGLQNLRGFLETLGEHRLFDGIVSNFGALNCVDDLTPLGELAATSLMSGGVVLIGLMGRSCAIEALYFASTRRRTEIRRRQGDHSVPVRVAGVDVPTFYHRTDDVCVALGRDLELAATTGIGVAIPPPYFERRWQTFPSPVRTTLVGLDRLVANWPPFNRLGDHVLLQFVKRGGAHA